ncbi:hypothetical protein QN239_31300 [Mycolicibacterium sp. Y3]
MIAIVAFVTTVAGCDDSPPPPWVSQLTDDQARDAMSALGINIPAEYKLVGMTSVRYPVGQPSYTGAFDRPTRVPEDGAMVSIDGAPAAVPLTKCDSGDTKTWADYGFTCTLANAQYVSFIPANRGTVEITAVTGTLTPGQTRLFVYSAGT